MGTDALDKDLDELDVLTYRLTKIRPIKKDATDFPIWPKQGHNRTRSTIMASASANGKQPTK